MHDDAKKMYSTFFTEHSKFIHSCIKNFIRVNNIYINGNDIDDIYQEIAIKIIKYRYVEAYDKSKSSLSTWIGTISRTATIDYCRKRKMVVNEEPLDELEIPMEQEQETPRIEWPSGLLSRRQAEVVVLVFQDGCRTDEVATRLRITPQTVRCLKFQALRKLRRHYGVAPEGNAQRRKA